jgi:DNA-binding response OmpR family regulator
MGIVLVVDDDADNRETLCEVLADEGYDVRAVAGGLQARALLEGGMRPDLVLLDLMMPGLSGDELIVWLRTSDASSVPVVVMSARHDYTPPEGIACLRKPASLTEVLDTVRAHVR